MVYGRLRAETGVPILWAFPYGQQHKVLWNFLGQGAIVPRTGDLRSPTIFAMMGFLSRGFFPTVSGYQIEGLHLAERTGVTARKMIVTLLIGFIALLAGFVTAAIWYARGVSQSGQSLGNRVAGSRVVDARNGRMLDTGEAVTRYALRFLVSTVLFGGFLVAFGNSERRTFHDKFAGSIVIRPARASWSIDDEVSAPPTA